MREFDEAVDMADGELQQMAVRGRSRASELLKQSRRPDAVRDRE